MTEEPALWSVEAAAEQLVRDIARQVPVTIATVALWDQPSFALRVKAVGASRPLAALPSLGTRVPLSRARWHRAVFEAQEPMLLERGSSPDGTFDQEAGLSLTPALQSVYLLPIRAGQEMVGVLGLGEMRSREREPFTELRRERCRAVLEEFLASSAPAWEAARLRRQIRAMSSLLAVVQETLRARSFEDVLASCASELSGWLGTPVRGILLRARPGHAMEVAARWRLRESLLANDAGPLLLALARVTGNGQWPVTVVRVDDDPLDPLHDAVLEGETLTRIDLPLLQGDRLLGIACLYVEDELRPAEWEMEALRRRAEIAAIGMGLVETLVAHRHEHDWLGRAAYELLTTHQRTVVRETLSGVIARVADILPGRLEQAGSMLPATPDWSILGRAVSQEVAAVLAELRDSVAQHEERAILHLDMNAVVRRAVEIARPRWEDDSRRRGISVQVEFEPAAEALMAEASVSLVGALVHAIDNAVEALPDGGLVHIRTAQVNGHIVISVGDTGGGVPDELRDTAFTPLFSTKGTGHAGLGLSILRAVASRHGGSVSLGQTASGGTVVEIRLPAASRPAGAAR